MESAERPGLADALTEIEDGTADGIIAPNLDRFARTLVVQEAILAQIWKHGGRAFTADSGEVHPDDPDDPMRTAMRQMMGVFAQLERSMIAARLRHGRREKAESGRWTPGRASSRSAWAARMPCAEAWGPVPRERRAFTLIIVGVALQLRGLPENNVGVGGFGSVLLRELGQPPTLGCPAQGQ
ncbi:hypothetical protein ABIE67_010273 [Streptomyces sp. V4I8]